MSRRKSEFKKRFEGETQADYIARTFGASLDRFGDSPVDVLSYLFFQSDWEELGADPALLGVIASVRARESQLRELRLRLEVLQCGGGLRCERCGGEFVARAGARFCSARCRVAAHRVRRAAGARAQHGAVAAVMQ